MPGQPLLFPPSKTQRNLDQPKEMEESMPSGSNFEQSPPAVKASIDQVLALLKSKDDTRRFVGLTLLMTSLESIKGNESLVTEFWNAVPRSFLTALLRAKAMSDANGTQNLEDAKAKFSLGLTVLHAFLSLIPQSCITQDQSEMDEMTKRMWNLRLDALMAGFGPSSVSVRLEILQVLCTIAANKEGAILLYQMSLERWKSLLDELPKQPMVLEIVRLTINGALNASVSIANEMLSKGSTMDTLLCMVLRNITGEVLSHSAFFEWFDLLPEPFEKMLGSGQVKNAGKDRCNFLDELARLIRKFINVSDRGPSHLYISFLQLAHDWVIWMPHFKFALFDISAAPPLSYTVSSPKSGAPTSFTFVTTLLIDVCSSIPSLQEILHTPEYHAISTRLANSYDLVFAYLDIILQEEDEEVPETTSRNQSPGKLPYNLIFSLQESITQLMHLTIEFLRDRYDSLSSTPNLSSTMMVAENLHVTLAVMARDQLTISQVGALGFWLNDEDSASADSLLEPLIQFSTCEETAHGLYARTLQAMLRDRPDLQREAETLVESLTIWPPDRENLRNIICLGHGG